MNLKKLTQAVFEGLPKEYRWAVVRNCGSANAFNSEPQPFKADFRDWDFNNVDTVSLGKGYDASDWQNSMIERQNVPTADKPESIHDVARSIEAARVTEKVEGVINFADLVLEDPVGSLAAEYKACMPRPDVDPRYFETSDVPETKKYPHYFKDVSGVDAIDLYHVARLYDITDPALFHAFKKIACAGKRGEKDQAQDVQEAIDALKRWQELNV